MTAKPNELTLGFLTAVTHRQLGSFGGYLVLNKIGRPLEFHCTAPIRPSRAQEILYGNTLQDYLYGDVLAQTLIERSVLAPTVVCTDRRAMLAVRAATKMPVLRILKDEADPNAGDAENELNPDRPDEGFRLGVNRVQVAADFPEDRSLAAEVLGDLAERFDLSEPFARIREAIKEAQTKASTAVQAA